MAPLNLAKWLIIDNQRTSVSITGERKFNVDTTPYVDQLIANYYRQVSLAALSHRISS